MTYQELADYINNKMTPKDKERDVALTEVNEGYLLTIKSIDTLDKIRDNIFSRNQGAEDDEIEDMLEEMGLDEGSYPLIVVSL